MRLLGLKEYGNIVDARRCSACSTTSALAGVYMCRKGLALCDSAF